MRRDLFTRSWSFLANKIWLNRLALEMRRWTCAAAFIENQTHTSANLWHSTANPFVHCCWDGTKKRKSMLTFVSWLYAIKQIKSLDIEDPCTNAWPGSAARSSASYRIKIICKITTMDWRFNKSTSHRQFRISKSRIIPMTNANAITDSRIQTTK